MAKKDKIVLKDTAIKLFEAKKVRTVWDEEQEKWWFSVVDIVAVLTDSDYQTARKYWKVLKGRLIDEGCDLFTNQQNNEVVTDCYHLKAKIELVSNTNQLKKENLRDNMTNLELIIKM